ncbi:MAG: hypothetical protein Q9219_000177 [cf. Caloplaca sp. 3 TL-2023]
MTNDKTYVVEHLDPECGPWSTLEYITIAKESAVAGAHFCLSSAPKDLNLPDSLQECQNLAIEDRSVEVIYLDQRSRVCLLDPAAKEQLSPEDGDNFDVFLFGGILGTTSDQSHSLDAPMTNPTSELRMKGFIGRRLGPVQMTTDTAVRVTRMVIQGHSRYHGIEPMSCSKKPCAVPLDDIPYIDHPEIRIDEHESTEMPFRYVKDAGGKPVMPEGMIELIKKDSEKGFGDLF